MKQTSNLSRESIYDDRQGSHRFQRASSKGVCGSSIDSQLLETLNEKILIGQIQKGMLLKIDGSGNIVKDKDYFKNATYDDARGDLASIESPRYLIWDFDYTRNDGSARRRIIFIEWIPDTASVRDKMNYGSSTSYLVNSLNYLFGTIIRADDPSGLDYYQILKVLDK